MNAFLDRSGRLGAEHDLSAQHSVAFPEVADSGTADPAAFDPAPFSIVAPVRQAAPIVFSSPHSGRLLPPDLIAAARLPLERLGRLEDRYVDELFAAAPQHGATLLCALVHRAYVDLNREPYELDPTMFADALPAHANVRSARVAAGLGAIARTVAEGGDIYKRKLTLAEAEARLDLVHRPYHAALDSLLDEKRRRFGCAILIDCHSMPSASLDRPADIVLGDRFGAACAPWLMELAETTLRALGYKVARNTPYAGGYVTQTYGKPQRRLHAMQVELRRDLYMDEKSLERRPDFAAVRTDMGQFAKTMCEAAETAGLS